MDTAPLLGICRRQPTTPKVTMPNAALIDGYVQTARITVRRWPEATATQDWEASSLESD